MGSIGVPPVSFSSFFRTEEPVSNRPEAYATEIGPKKESPCLMKIPIRPIP